MFEDKTYENIRDEMLAEFPDDIDIREGSIAYDSVSAVAAKAAMLYVDIANCYELTNLEKSTGEYLDRFASEHGLTRISATSAVYELIYEGKPPTIGDEFYEEEGEYYFTVSMAKIDGIDKYVLVSNDHGTDLNNISYGTLAIPVENIEGLVNSSFGNIVKIAIDEETDEALRSRIRDKISGPAENGNRAQYKSWCESVEGVGRAFITSLKYGPNTVEGMLISPQGLPVENDVVNNVQNFIDPKEPPFCITHTGQKIELGSGYGDGVANIGAHFRAVSAEAYMLTIKGKIELSKGYTLDSAIAEIKKSVSDYLKELALYTDSKIVRYSKIGSLIEQLNSVSDYFNLTINNSSENLIVPNDAVAVLAEVLVDVSV